ncbi:MAG TPA: DNA topoisomerase IB [Thermoanaerobaculia bacterium]|nr:DNA topoisomerase IB [Thermoanaerobaculia bacterium]
MTRIERLEKTGIRRVGTATSGFRYRRADGSAASREDLDRIHWLKLPPAWTDVAIDPRASAPLQAIGKDAAGRWQYRYHEAHVKRRERAKLRRIIAFAAALPRMRAAIARDLALPGLPREKVFAAIVRIMATRYLRPGSRRYAQENDSYGLVTLRRKHVTAARGAVRLKFRGKSGKEHDVELTNPEIVRVVRACLRLPGRQVFQYANGGGEIVAASRKSVNAYIKEIMGASFSAKDFRTWAGTLICANLLAKEAGDLPETRRGRRRKITAAVKETARRLGNTPAVCRASYIAPAVVEQFERGVTLPATVVSVDRLVERRSLHRAEKALMTLLRREAA